MDFISNTQINGGDTEHKIPRIRSVGYPSSTIEVSYQFTSKIDQEFTSVVYTPRDAISKNLGMSGGSFLTQLSNATQYGLLDLKTKEGYKPSELFCKIKKPLPSENVRDFYLECLNTPELYKKLLIEFNYKQLPTETGLANILDRNYGVKGDAATRAAKTFLKNLQWLQLIGEGNILNLGSYITYVENTPNELGDRKEESEMVKKTENGVQVQEVIKLLPETEKKPPEVKKEHSAPATKTIPIFLEGEDRELIMILPIDFDDKDKKRVIRFLNTYVP